MGVCVARTTVSVSSIRGSYRKAFARYNGGMRSLLFALLIACGCGSHADSANDGGNTHEDGGTVGDGSDGSVANLSCLGAKLGSDHLMIGFAGDDATMYAAPFDVRYQYLSGGMYDGAAPCASCTSCTAAGVECDTAKNPAGCGWWGCWQAND